VNRVALTSDLLSLIVLVGGLLVMASSLLFVLFQILQGYM
jgi:hypothetical protein